MVVNIGPIEVIACVAVLVTLYLVPAVLARRVAHGEARFDKNGKLIDDE